MAVSKVCGSKSAGAAKRKAVVVHEGSKGGRYARHSHGGRRGRRAGMNPTAGRNANNN